MKVIIATLTATLALTIAAASPAAAKMCVQSRDILGTNSKDGKLMTFRMRDGRILVNHLQGVCSDLKFEGFVHNHAPDRIDIGRVVCQTLLNRSPHSYLVL